MDRTYNVFVLALDDFHRRELETVDWEDCRFHGLLDPEDIVHSEDFPVKDLLRRARRQLDDFEGSVDAIIVHWDFPLAVMAPILCEERGLRAPTLEAVLRCSDKFWSRLEQRKAIPDMTPKFATVDPFEELTIDDVGVDPPFWIKPVAAFSSQLGFKIEGEEDLQQALKEIREGIDRIGDPFEDILDRAQLPAEVADVGAHHCLVEEYLTGVELAHEGSVFEGKTYIHGTIDMVREEEIFTRYQLPSTAPKSVLDRMEAGTSDLLSSMEFDNGCFNVEYFWDPETDRLSIIEVNPRISQSHTYLFDKVAGRSNHQVAVDVALGRKPRLSGDGGRYACAAKFLHTVREDGVVREVPDEEDMKRAKEIFPEAWIDIVVEEGDRLSEMTDQDAYSYNLAEISLAADSQQELLDRYDRIVEALDFKITPG